MKKILCVGLLLISATIINSMLLDQKLTLDDSKEFTPQVLTHFRVPQPLLEAIKNPENKKALRYLGLRLYNRRVAPPLTGKGKGDFLYFNDLADMKQQVSSNPTPNNIQKLAHWLSRRPIPTGVEFLKKESTAHNTTYTHDGNTSTRYMVTHPNQLGDFCEIICKHISHIAQNEDWTPVNTENVMTSFLKIYLNIDDQQKTQGK